MDTPTMHYQITWGVDDVTEGKELFPTLSSVRSMLLTDTELTPTEIDRLIAFGQTEVSDETGTNWIRFAEVL